MFVCVQKSEGTSYVQKYYIWNLATCNWKNGNFLASIVDDSVVTSDEIIDTAKSVATNYKEKKVNCKTKNLYVLPVLLITITLLIVVSIYC